MTPEQLLRFHEACHIVLAGRKPEQGIGTLGEKSLHAVLKYYYQPDESQHERKIGRMTADAILPNGSILEIQTRSFYSLRKKLPLFLAYGQVHLVAPVIQKKWVCWLHPETGEVVSKRLSPKHYSPIDLSRELGYIRKFLLHPKLTVHFPLLEAEEYRLLDGWGNDGKRGSTRYERIPLNLLEEWVMKSPQDYIALLPDNLPEVFTIKELEKAARISSKCAYTAAAIFRETGTIREYGCRGRAKCYRRNIKNKSLLPDDTPPKAGLLGK